MGIKMSTTQANHVLDNLAWYALNSHHAHFASGTDLVKTYPPDVMPVSALVNYTEAACADLGRVIKKGEITIIIGPNPPQIPGWTIQQTLIVDQMVCQQRLPQPKLNVDIVELNNTHVADIMQLLDAEAHLFFTPRAIEMGHFIGIRQQGQLVAVAGERYHLTGYCEISTVCTHPDWQGKGYARALVSILANEIWDNGETPYLSVEPENTGAIRLYERLNFRKRGDMFAFVMGQT